MIMDNNCNDFETYCMEMQSRSGNISPSTENLFSNKDVLARRLKCRLEREDLVVRGIMPSHHTSPTIAAQIHQLERAKTGDLLQKRMRVRASRQQLVQRHILADSKVDASLQEKQSSLERHIIADHLNEQLFNRPGPLELIKENILEVEPKFADAVKHGCVPFHATCEDGSTSPINAAFSESSTEIDCGSSVDSLSPFASDSIDTFSQAFSDHVNVNNMSDKQAQVVSSFHAVAKVDESKNVDLPAITNYFPRDTCHKGEKARDVYIKKQLKSSKKIKQPQNKSKKKKYKYHEYKPPGSVPQTYQAPLDERYKRLLEQQQMFLQLQVMKQNALFAALQTPEGEKCINDTNPLSSVKDQANTSSVFTSTTPVSGSNQQGLGDLRVIDLRSELRQRGLPVSGSKAKLLERLKSYQGNETGDKEKESRVDDGNSNSPLPSSGLPSVTSVDTSTPASSNSNTLMKVTTYATQNGQTFQVVQAVPNVHPQIQYQVFPESLVLNQAPMHAAQMQRVEVINDTTPKNPTVQIQKPVSSQNPHVFQSDNTNVVGSQIPNTLLQQIQYIRQLPTHTTEQLQIQVAPSTATSVGLNTLQNTNASIFQSQQLSLVRPMGNDIEALPVQQVNEVKEQRQVDDLQSCSTADQYPNHPFLLQRQISQPNCQRSNSSSTQSALLLHLQQIRNTLNLTGDDQLRVEKMINDKNNDLITKYSMQSDNCQSYPANQSDFVRKNVFQNSFMATEDSNPIYRSRSHTDPVRHASQNNNGSLLDANMSSPLIMQQNGTVVVVNSNGSNMNLSGKEESKAENAGIKAETQASEDLLEILGEISSSARSTVGDDGFHSTDFRSNTVQHDFHLEKKGLETERRELQRLNVKQEPAQFLPSCSKQKLSNPRTYGSLPGDLNMLGIPVHSAYNSSQSSHGSCSSLTNNTPASAARLLNNPYSTAQNITSAPMHVDEDCINMDIDEGVYLTSENELEWLNLNNAPVSSSHTQKVFGKLHNKEPAINLCVDSLDLNMHSSNPYDHYGKPHEMNSMFDMENSQPLMMIIDGQDTEKWGF